jgi:hypothetical protein
MRGYENLCHRGHTGSTVACMSPGDAADDDLIGLEADERLLGTAPDRLPVSLGHPASLPVSAARGRIVGVGVTLTGVTLVGGAALAIYGLIALPSGGGVVPVVALVLGLLLAGTHWGWVHVAEATAVGLDRRASVPAVDQRQRWLRAVAPFTRYEIATTAGDDGSITIERLRYRPARAGEHTFVFEREVELHEIHGGDEPAAVISERAELLRRQAAHDTERERQRFQTRADEFERAALAAEDDRGRAEVRAAESRALSDQINANLREPPLVE